jgi:hypothetical protein
VPHQQLVVLAVQLLSCELNTTAPSWSSIALRYYVAVIWSKNPFNSQQQQCSGTCTLHTYAAAATQLLLLPLLPLLPLLLLLAHLDAWEAHAVA